MKRVNNILQKVTGCKNVLVEFSLNIEGKNRTPKQVTIEVNNTDKVGIIYNVYDNLAEETVWFSWDEYKSIWKRSIKNISGKTLRLKETLFQLQGVDFGKTCPPKEDYYYHVENPRIYKMMAMPVDLKLTQELIKKSDWDCLLEETGYNDPALTTDRIGASPYQPFPAMLVSNHSTKKGIVHGTLNQNVFYHNYSIKHNKDKVDWKIFSSLKTIEYRNFAANETIDEDVWYLGITEDSDNISSIFQGYLTELRKHLPVNIGKTDTNRYTALWGSSNDGPVQDIDQDRILKTAKFMKKNIPAIEWIYIDWGYGTVGEYKGGLGVPYEKGVAGDPKKFPEGLKKYADKVKQTGMKPAIWISGMIERANRFAKEHPEWLYDRFPSDKGPRILDISIPEVRSFMEKSLDTLITEFGFEGVKHDLWSYPFEDSRPLLSKKDKSAYELRRWWSYEMRKRLPSWGYMQTGCDIVMANPFLGEFFNNYRYGIDVCEGSWDNVEANMLWGAACFATQCGDLFIPNSDAIGILPGLKDNEYLLWLNYCIISRSIVETGGWHHKNYKHPRYKFVKKAFTCLNNGQDIYFSDYNYRTTDKHPDKWYFKGAHFSLLKDNSHLPVRTVAFFNTGDTPKTFKIDNRKLGLPTGKYLATDVWSLKTTPLQAYNNIKIEPRNSLLFSVSKVSSTPQILDSDIKLEEVFYEKNKLSIKFAYSGQFKIIFSQKPKRASLSSKFGKTKIVQGDGNWLIEGETRTPDTMVVSF